MPMSDTNNSVTNNGRDPKTGQFVKGYEGGPGRQRGSRNRLTEQFLSDLCHEWELSGAAALKEIAKTSPVDYVRVVAALVPHRVDASLAIIDAELLREQTNFAAAYKIARSVIGADTETPLIEVEANNETKAEA
jgi:hypothetical protein